MVVLLLKVVLHALTDYAVPSPKFFEVHIFLTCVCNELPFFAGSSATYFFSEVLFFIFLSFLNYTQMCHILISFWQVNKKKQRFITLDYQNSEGLIYCSNKKSKSEILCGP